MADLRYLLAIYVHAHQTGNSVPPHIDAEARAAIREVAAYMQENYADTDWVTTAAVACVIADLKEESDR